MDWRLDSSPPGILWPAIPAPAAAATLSLLYQLDKSQWLAPQALLQQQLGQLRLLLCHARDTVPYYRERMQAFDPRAPATLDTLAALPILRRLDLLERYAELKSEAPPPEHGAVAEARTSGSTGAPVRLLKTDLQQAIWNACTLRDHHWHRRDLGATLAVIRMGASKQGENWGPATLGLAQTGRAHVLDVRSDVEAQLAWLERVRPAYLLTYPSNVAALAAFALERGRRLPGLREVRTLGELLPPETRELCRQAWGVPVTDFYSAEEAGYIALQCPQTLHYHVQSESVLVEVLDERGAPAAEGGTGRLVITDLHNFAMPLIRYEIGDYAEVGGACECGRGLPALRRIVGRVRNMLVAPDGRSYWPTFGQRAYLDVAPVIQHQFVLKARDHVEARFVLRSPLTPAQEAALRKLILAKLPAGMRVSVVQVPALSRSAGGKYEDFLSEVGAR